MKPVTIATVLILALAVSPSPWPAAAHGSLRARSIEESASTSIETSASTGTADPGSPPSGDVTPTAQPVTIRVGTSVKGRPIHLTRFGSGARRVLIVGGIHGDEAGTDVARAYIAYLRAHPSAIPRGTQVDVLACANPDGFVARTRANARRVDLNRNFPSATWRRLRWGRITSGSRASSEPETRALVSLLARRYSRVVSLHSGARWVDGRGRGGATLARRIARTAGVRFGDESSPGDYPGSMGTYLPERYPATASVCWELSSRRMTTAVLRGLLVAVR